VRSFLETKYKYNQDCYDVPKLKYYFSLPYFGQKSEKLRRELCNILTGFYPYIDFRFVLTNKCTIGSLFRFKDSVPRCLKSKVVYKFCCAQCGASYIGSTVRSLKLRIDQHRGVSSRTNLPFSRPDASLIREHVDVCGGIISADNFSILGGTCSGLDLRILESLYISKLRTQINNYKSAFPLTINCN